MRGGQDPRVVQQQPGAPIRVRVLFSRLHYPKGDGVEWIFLALGATDDLLSNRGLRHGERCRREEHCEG